jgi:hypothetical protein
MRPVWLLATAALAISTAAPASAALVQYEYAGLIGLLLDASHPGGANVGDPVNVVLRFDTADLVDVTDLANGAFGNAYDHLEAASLKAPGALLRVSAAQNKFTQADQFDFFADPFGFGGPYVLFNSGKFFGIQFFGLDAKMNAFTTAGARPEQFDFVGGHFAPDSPPSYAGFFDYSTVISHAVPEPATWALMISGFGLAGAALRRRRKLSADKPRHPGFA